MVLYGGIFMRTKSTYICSAMIALFLCVAILGGSVFSAAGAQTLPSLEYHNPTIENNATLSASQLYALLLEQEPTAGEALYWASSELSLTYTDFVPESRISTDYDGELGILKVTVQPYAYTAVNGATVTWFPTGLTIDGENYALQAYDGSYVVQIENCFYSSDFQMQVDYECQVEIPKEIVATLHNEAYEKGDAAHEEMEVYRQALKVYNNILDINNKWEAYEQWERDYANYLVELALYNQLKEVYDAYMVEYNAYATVLDAYNQWQNYFAQQKAYAENEKPYAEYMDFYKVYSAAVDKLAMFESAFQRDSRGWCAYRDIMGKTVTEVLGKQDLLIAAGANREDVILAGQATENLRKLLKGYNDIREKEGISEYQKNKQLYQYYTKNYDALKKNFCDLYKTLNGLYGGNYALRRFIEGEGKGDHYRQLVGHLYVISTSLDQNGYRDANWKIAGKSLMEVIEPMHFFEDGDWDPKNTTFPAVEVPKVDRIEMPVRPSVEQPTVVPDPPTPVENPGEPPAVVEDPSGTPRPEAPKPLGDAPKKPTFTPAVELLYQEIEAGTLKPFVGVAKAKTITLHTMVERVISIRNLKTVTLYNPDGSVYKHVSVNYGEGFVLEPLFRENTAEYTYEWLSWTTFDGGKPDTSCITTDIALYPLYRATKNIYTITWVVDGVSYPVSLYYGAMPVPEVVVDISTKESEYYRYEFSGWDREVTPVTGDATYTGSMVHVPKKFEVTWVIKNGTESIKEKWAYGETPAFSGELSHESAQYVYEFLGWDKAISPVRGDVTYTAKYIEKPLAVGGNDTVLKVEHSDSMIAVSATEASVSVAEAAKLALRQGKTLRVEWQNGLAVSLAGEQLQAYVDGGTPRLILQQNQVEDKLIYSFRYHTNDASSTVSPTLTVHLPYSKANGCETLFDLGTEDGWQALDTLELTLTGAFEVRCSYTYRIIPEANEFCNVTQIIDSAQSGETVSIDLDCVYGYEVVGATLVTETGEVIVVNGLTFTMPASPVTVTLTVERVVYRVSFLVDGNVWHYAEYGMGEEIILPDIPTKEAEEGYVYTFIGWGNVPAIAVGDEKEMTFVAEFSKSKVGADYQTGHNNNVMFGIVLPILLAVVALVVLFFVLRRIARKMGGWRVLGTKCGVWFVRIGKKIADGIRAIFAKLKK